MRILILVFGLVALVGCASATPQVDGLLAHRSGVPKVSQSYVIQNVPFIEQSAGYCGPATLTMALRWAGKNVSVNELASQVYTPRMKGSLQTDMISASRRQGMMAVPIEGFDALLTEIDAGHPVIIFENLAVSWLPQWHYAIVFGYDLKNQTILMHSGPESFKNWDIRKFERSWKLGEYWGLVVLPAGELAASADEWAHVSAASALEDIGKLDEAKKSYEVILSRWPKSLLPPIGLANIAYAQGEFQIAIEYLIKATTDHPDSAIAWHNLALAQSAAGQKREARESAQMALKQVSPDLLPSFSDNLKSLM